MLFYSIFSCFLMNRTARYRLFFKKKKETQTRHSTKHQDPSNANDKTSISRADNRHKVCQSFGTHPFSQLKLEMSNDRVTGIHSIVGIKIKSHTHHCQKHAKSKKQHIIRF